MSGVYGNQQLYLAPLVEIKDIGSRFRRHHPDGYIILNGGVEASRLRDRLKTDGYTFSLFAREHIENGMRILEHFFVVYIDKIDRIHRGKVNAKEHQYKCTFEELLAYGKRLCATEEFNQEVFSVKFPDDGDAVWMNGKKDVVTPIKRTPDDRFYIVSTAVFGNQKAQDIKLTIRERSKDNSWVNNVYQNIPIIYIPKKL